MICFTDRGGTEELTWALRADALLILWAGALFGAGAGVPAAAAAQEVVTIADRDPVCAACRLTFDEIGRIGGPSDTLGIVSMDAGRTRLRSDGTVVLALAMVPYVVAVFDLAGGAPRTFGRKGSGPGEFRRIWLAAPDSAGRLRVFGDGRETILDGDGEVVETRQALTRPEDLLFLADGSYVMNGFMPERDRAGWPLHRVGRDGKPLHSFGREGRGTEFDGFAFVRKLAHAGPGRFWAAEVNRYRMTEWDTAGRPLRVVEREASWFRRWDRWVGPWEGRPPPRLADIVQDADGRIWTMVWIADEDYRPISPDDVDLRAAVDDGDHPMYDTVIEVLDPVAGRLLLSQRLGRLYAGFEQPGVVSGWAATPEGYQEIVFYRVAIEGTTR